MIVTSPTGEAEDDTPRIPIERRVRQRARLGVLAEISTLLASSDDHVTILQKLTEIAVPALGDWCVVHVVSPSGLLERVAIRHSDPAKLELADTLARGARPDPTGRGAARVAATGHGEWIERICEVEHICADAQREPLAALGIRSYIAVPLIVRGRVTGVLTLVRCDREYERDDQMFAEELARRVALFVDNAMLLREVQAREAALRDEASRLETLNRIGQELAAIHDLDQVMKKVCEAATALTGAELGVFSTDADGEVKYAMCGARFEEAHAISAASERLAPSSSAFGLHRPLRVDDVRITTALPNLGLLAGLGRVVSYLAVPVRGRRGDVIGAIALAHSRPSAFDGRAEQLVLGLASLTATATDSARLFREARELIAALEKSNRDLDQFAYVTSHDLRAPLRGIANLSQWIEEDLEGKIPDVAREHLRLLHGRVQRLEDIIEGVLKYSRAGRVDDEPVDLDLGVLVREVVELLAPPRTTHVVIPPGLPTVRTARVPLEQVLMNLIANALKHNPHPEPLVEIGARPCTEGWEICVRDNGPGIPPQFQDKIWDLFQTVKSRDKTHSSGIGLSLVRRIVEAHGGRAWVDSGEGRGATFRFTWPKSPPSSRSWDRRR